MFYDEGQATLKLELGIENDLEVDANGNFYVVTLIFQNSTDDDPEEVRVSFEDVLDNVIDFYRDTELSQGNIGYGQLYAIANEFERAVDKLREVAGHMEGRVFNHDIFDYYDDDESNLEDE
jgi:hypothetical protein